MSLSFSHSHNVQKYHAVSYTHLDVYKRQSYNIMKNIKIRFFILCLCLSVTGYTSASARTEKVKTDIDWPAFMQKQDLIWEILPEYWYESAYMGNGMLGLMIYKEPGHNYIRFETGNCSVHDHKAGSDLFAIPRLLTGHFALHLSLIHIYRCH